MAVILPNNTLHQFSLLLLVWVLILLSWGVKADNQSSRPASNAEFDESFLNVEAGNKVDLSRFSEGASVLPGTYLTAIYINNTWVDSRNIELKLRHDKSVYPCLYDNVFKHIDFNYEKLPQGLFSKQGFDECIDLTEKLPESQVSYDSNEQRLDIIIPQAYMLNTARGSVRPELWDRGIPAFLLGYNINGYRNDTNNSSYHSLYAGFDAGLNMGSWYFRHYGSYNWMDNGQKQYTNLNTYLQRDVPVLKGRVLLGQSNTNGQIFNTLPFSGIQLASDEQMLPESQRGYAPDIRGIARTNARITVRQNSQILLETTVPPGAFLINDLFPTGYGGDLDVTVRESDGTEQHFRVPYASVTQLLRPGTSRYSFTSGELRSENVNANPLFYQSTYQHGLTNALTGYGGVLASEHYVAVQVGSAWGTSLGAWAFDITQANTKVDGDNSHSKKNFTGQSYQFSYSKTNIATQSNLSLAAYRFSTDGYMDFMTAMQTRDAISRGGNAESVARAKNRVTVTGGQGMGDTFGHLYLSGSLQDYWNRGGREKQWQFGYNNQYRMLAFGLSVNRSYSSLGATQTHYLLSFSVPLGRSDETNTPYLRMDLQHDSTGQDGQQASLSGTAGKDNRFGYSLTGMNANQGSGSSGSVSANYRSVMTALSSTYSTGKGYKSTSAGMTGTLIGHSGGITLTPYTSDTFALVEAKGAEGAGVSSYAGIKVDSRGYAVVPYLNPYQMNEINIDPSGIGHDVELDNTSQKVAPNLGAVVKVKYSTTRGTPILFDARYQNEALPFGADVQDEKNNSVGSVGQGGLLYARVGSERGQLRVKWGESHNMQCTLNYVLIPQDTTSLTAAIQRFESECRPVINQHAAG